MKFWLSTTGVIVGFILFIMVLSLGTLAWRYFTADIKGIVGAEETITSSGFRLGAYERFFDQCAAVQAIDVKLATQQRLLKSEEGDARQMVLRNISGLEAQRANMVSEYNAASTKDYTEARFKDAKLPYRLSLAYDPNNPVACE